MKLSIGIAGLPNAGKSTIFNALTDAGALAASYPFATIDPNVGMVAIPDRRLDTLAEIFSSHEIVPAMVRFVDIAGLVEGAHRGEGLGNKFLAHIRDVKAICHVVRAFRAPEVAHVAGTPDPRRDIETVETELALSDLEILGRAIEKLERAARGVSDLQDRLELLGRVREVVAQGGRPASDPRLAPRLHELDDLGLLTSKPVIYVFNADSHTLEDEAAVAELEQAVAPAEAVFVDAKLEAELAELSPAERAELTSPETRSGLEEVVGAAYRALGLQSFLTAREKEARAWTIRSGATAREAAGVIHTDFQRGFIAAEVVGFPQLVEAGSWQRAKAQGLVRTEGKDYVLAPEDVVEFRFNV